MLRHERKQVGLNLDLFLAYMLAGVLIVSGLGKVVSPDVLLVFISKVVGVGRSVGTALVYLIAIVELAVASLLLGVRSRRDHIAAQAATAFFAVMVLANLSALALGIEGPCGCFGGVLASSWGWHALVRACVLFFGSVILSVTWSDQNAFLRATYDRKGISLLSVIGVLIVASAIMYESITYISEASIPVNIDGIHGFLTYPRESMSIEHHRGNMLVAVFSPECSRCQVESFEWTHLRNNLDRSADIGFFVIGLGSMGNVESFMIHRNLNVGYASLPVEVAGLFGIRKVPLYFLIRSGSVVGEYDSIENLAVEVLQSDLFRFREEGRGGWQ